LAVGFTFCLCIALGRLALYFMWILSVNSTDLLLGTRSLGVFYPGAEVLGSAYLAVAFFKTRRRNWRLRVGAFALAATYLCGVIAVYIQVATVSSELDSYPAGLPFHFSTAATLALSLAAVFAGIAFVPNGTRYRLLRWAAVGLSVSCAMQVPAVVARGGTDTGDWATLLTLLALVLCGILAADSFTRLAAMDLASDREYSRRELIICLLGGSYLVQGLALGDFSHWSLVSPTQGAGDTVANWLFQISRFSPIVLGLSVFVGFLVSWSVISRRSRLRGDSQGRLAAVNKPRMSRPHNKGRSSF